jgi:hypothetical protein
MTRAFDLTMGSNAEWSASTMNLLFDARAEDLFEDGQQSARAVDGVVKGRPVRAGLPAIAVGGVDTDGARAMCHSHTGQWVVVEHDNPIHWHSQLGGKCFEAVCLGLGPLQRHADAQKVSAAAKRRKLKGSFHPGVRLLKHPRERMPVDGRQVVGDGDVACERREQPPVGLKDTEFGQFARAQCAGEVSNVRMAGLGPNDRGQHAIDWGALLDGVGHPLIFPGEAQERVLVAMEVVSHGDSHHGEEVLSSADAASRGAGQLEAPFEVVSELDQRPVQSGLVGQGSQFIIITLLLVPCPNQGLVDVPDDSTLDGTPGKGARVNLNAGDVFEAHERIPSEKEMRIYSNLCE